MNTNMGVPQGVDEKLIDMMLMEQLQMLPIQMKMQLLDALMSQSPQAGPQTEGQMQEMALQEAMRRG